MDQPVLLLLLVALLLLWAFVRRRRSAPEKNSAPTMPVSHESTAFHAVSIKFQSSACQAARELEGRRFLSTAAPRLPLPDCDVLECNCRFVHHRDRRTGNERRSPFPAHGFIGGTGNYEQEQRAGRDRRAGDDDDRY